MKDLLEKGIAATLGFWLLLHEKADDIIKEMIEQGKIAPEEGRKFLDELSVRVEKEKNSLKGKMKSYSQIRISELGFVTKSEFEKLSARVDSLEKKGKKVRKKTPGVSKNRKVYGTGRSAKGKKKSS
jgi:polyhydroxyalkanoate synthesis regulator phasin